MTENKMEETKEHEKLDQRYSLDNTKKLGIAGIYILPSENEEKPIKEALEKDAEDFEPVLDKLGFSVKIFNESKEAGSVAQCLKKHADGVQEEDQCFLGIFIGHGSPGTVESRHGSLGIHSKIIPMFAKIDWLKGKPKIFVFQACRGAKMCIGMPTVPGTLALEELNIDCSDILLCYASFHGFVSYGGNTDKPGTLYLQKFKEILKTFADGNNSLVDILTRLNSEVRASAEIAKAIQMPSFESSLRKKICLKYQNMDRAPSGDTEE
ncbi:caspase-3-like [Ciona intestinalis]